MTNENAVAVLMSQMLVLGDGFPKYREAMEMAIAALREQEKLESNLKVLESSGWISVEDAMPEDNEKVLVCTHSKKMCVARWSARQEKFVASGNLTVAHWMPLPEMPEK